MPYKDIDKRRAFHRAYQREWIKKHPESWEHIREAHNLRKIQRIGLEEFRRRNREKSKAWRLKNLERWKVLQARSQSRPHNKERLRRQRRLKKYGLTHQTFEALYAKQQGKCAICSAPFVGRRKVHIDHCHDRKCVRGLLCGTCNSGLGHFKDDIVRLQMAIQYLSTRNV